MSKKIAPFFSLILIASMLLAGCAQATSPAPTAPPAATAVVQAPAATNTTAAQPTKPPEPTKAPEPTKTPEPTKAPVPVFLTINTEQVSTWVRNFNPFSPDARGATGTAIYEPMMIYNKSTGKVVPWLATDFTWSADSTDANLQDSPGGKVVGWAALYRQGRCVYLQPAQD